MQRRHVQRAFMGATLLLSVLVAASLASWLAAQRTAAQLLTAASTTTAADPRVQMAQATQWRAQGRVDEAVRVLQALAARRDLPEGLALDVRYNLGNALLVLALQSNTRGDEDRALTLVELSKQRYREVLRLSPNDWDARHNLEKALRLAPENDPPPAAEKPSNVQRIQVEMRGIRAADLP
jgi:mxaK protein